jgi:hypothetical protein
MKKMKNLLLLLVCFLSSQLLPAAAVLPGADAASGCRVNPPNTEITILFAYTTNAAIAAGGPKNIKRDVDNGMSLLNTALANNNITLTVRAITEFVQVEYGSATSDAAVTDLLAELRKTNGKFNKVHQFRQQKQADMVCLVYSGFAMGKADLDGAFMVCHYSTFGDTYVFPHEFGHLMGATHEAGKTFNFGEGPTYRTVAANGGVAIPYFSEPRTINLTLGTAVRTLTLGDATHNNAGKIKANMAAKSALGEALTVVANATGAAAATLVNPATAPTPAGPVPYTITSFTVNNAGIIVINYTTSDATAFTVEGYETGQTKSFGGFSTRLDCSKNTMNESAWGAPYPGDRYDLKIDGVVVRSYTAP